jgi:hypothetical protein
MERKAFMEVFVPVGKAEIKPLRAVTRPDTLDSKRVALHWNEKPGGEFLLAEIKKQLSAKCKNVEFVEWPKGTVWKADIESFMKEKPADVAIVSVGD